MKVTINDREYVFSFRGFGPQYTYEIIAGEPYQHGALRSMHVLLYATLLSCNRSDFKLKIDDFTEWLYDHPVDERAMVEAIREESERRAAALDKKKE